MPSLACHSMRKRAIPCRERCVPARFERPGHSMAGLAFSVDFVAETLGNISGDDECDSDWKRWRLPAKASCRVECPGRQKAGRGTAFTVRVRLCGWRAPDS